MNNRLSILRLETDGDKLTRENGAHWDTAHAAPVRAISTVAPEVPVTKLETSHE